MKVKRHIWGLLAGLLARLLSAPQRWRRPLATVTFFVLVASGVALERTSAGGRFASFTWPESLSRIFGNRTTRTLGPVTQTISGTVFDSNGFPLGGRTIKLIQNGTLSGTTAMSDNVTGIYTFTGLTLANDDKIVVYIGAGAAEKGATFTFTGTSDITTLNIYQNQLVVRSDDGSTITNANLKAAVGLASDADLLSVSSIDALNVVTTPSGISLQIWSATNYAPGADINDGGNWINNGVFTAGTDDVNFNGTSNQTIHGSSSTTFSRLDISNTGTSPDNVVSLDGSAGATNTVVSRLTITSGVFDQGTDLASSSLIVNGTARCVDVGPNGTWRNRGRGDDTLSCDVFNEGTIIFNSLGSACGEDDEIQIRSSVTGIQRTWEGPGTFSMTDVDVQDQRVPGGLILPPQILVNSGTDSTNNTAWTFLTTCAGPYTWIGAAGQQWGDEVNWSPIRTTANDASTTDVLIFDGSVTPATVVEDVQSQTNSAIRLQNGVDVTLHANLGGSTLTLNGATGNDLDVPANTFLTLAESRPLVIELTAPTGIGGSVPAGHVAGQIIMKDDKHQLIGDNAGEIIFTGTNAFTIDSSYSLTTHPFGEGTSGSVIFQSPAIAVFGSGLDPLGGEGKSVVTFNAGSTAHFLATTAFLGDAGTYGNLIFDGAQNYTIAGSSPITILNNLEIEPGSTFLLSNSPGADLNLYGNFEDNTAISTGFSPNGRVVKFLGTTQTVSKAGGGIAGFDAVLINQSPGGKVQLLSPTDISQLNLSTADALLELNGQVLELIGTVTGPGNLKGDPNAIIAVTGVGDLGTLNFVSGGRTLSGLLLDRLTNGSMTLGTNLDIAGTLRLDDGILNTGANTLSLSSVSTVLRSNGYVIGNLQKSFGVSGNLGSFTFPLGTANAYSPIDANATANTNGTLTVKAVQGKQPNIPGANALQRYWTLSGSGITADLTFHYSTSPTNDVVGNEAIYKIFKYDGSFTQFTPDATGSNSASDHFATVNNISSFSDWTLAEATAVSPGSLQFSAANFNDSETNADHTATITVTRTGGSAGAVSVHWTTSAGSATAGTDYIESSGDVNWNDGDSADKTFTVTVKGDTTFEPDETVNLTLSAPTGGATIGGTNPSTLTIINDDTPCDPAPVVANTNDSGTGSLRQALADVCDGGAITFDTAGTFATPQTITLSNQLTITTDNVTIDGPDPASQRVTIVGGGTSRLFRTQLLKTATIRDLTLTGGSAPILDNYGGAIYNDHATLTLIGLTVSGSSAAFGGGIYNDGLNGLFSTLTIINSTISGNTVSGAGGGIYNIGTGGSATLNLTNSTVSGNNAAENGGGIFSAGESGNTPVTITNCTITNNRADNNTQSSGTGGGLFVIGGTALTLRNSIVDLNFVGGSPGTTASDIVGSVVAGGASTHNLIGSCAACGLTNGADNNSLNVSAASLNIGPLAANDAINQTHALLAGSIAIDAGNDAYVVAPPFLNVSPITDGRGTGFMRVLGPHVDIGAFEAEACTTPPATPTITPQGPTTFCEGGSVTLTSSSAGGNQWYKDNVLLSGETNQNYIASTSGNYTVTVTENGCTSAPSAATTVTVNPIPATPTASNGGPYCEGATISLSTPTVAGATYSWTGPNGFTSNQQNPARANATTADAGIYSVTITVNGCTSAAGTTNVVVNPTPATPTASNGGPYCEGATISLSTPTVAGATYSWTGPNGFTSNQQNPTRTNATTADAGIYSVTITVNGCTSAAGTTNVVVNATPATPTASNGGPYCEGATIQLSTPTVSGATYSWTGPNGFTSSLQNPSRTNATTADAGVYSITITVNGCTSAAGTTNVVVNPTPATPTASNGGPYCEGATISLSTPTVAGATYLWTGPNGFTSSDQNPIRTSATTADAGIYSVTITVNGCTSAAGTTTVVVNPTPATPTASNGGPYCEGATISLSTPTVAGATYSWTGPNGFTSNQQNPARANATTADAGVYSVTTTVNGCTSAAGTTTVVVNPTPATPTASNGGPYCEGATISLSTPTVAGATYLWTGPNGFTSSDQNPIRTSATTADAGIYSVTITVNGCTSAAGTTTVVVNPTPATPTASNGGPYCEGATISLSTPTVAGATYSWTGPNGFTSNQQNPTRTNATTADAGTYSLTITVNGCTSAAGTTNVVVNATPATPTASNSGPYFEGATISLSTPSVAGATYSWSGPNSFTSSVQNPTRANATGADAGTYSVIVTVNGCSSAAGTTNVVVIPLFVSAGDGQTAEPASGTSQLLFTIALSAPAPAAGASVNYATAAGGANPATAGPVCGGSVDYQTTNGAVNFAPGEQIKTIAVTVCADGTSEPDETLLLNLSSPTSATISDGQATGTITTVSQAGTFLISELRTSGPGGLGDDFVELYNNTDSQLTVPAGGYGLFKMGADCTATPILIGTVAAGTLIPARGHYLFVGSQYSLADYGGIGAAAGDATLASDIESDGNVALFSTADVANISSANRLDAVGFGTNVSDNCALLKEGTNLTAVAGSNTEHSYFRKLCDFVAGVGCTTPGTPKDTNDNSADFMFADTQGTFISGVPQRLGAPGPENLTSPIKRDTLGVNMLDSTVPSSAVPNRMRDFTMGANATFGHLMIRRRVVNNTGGNVTRLRFRIVEMTTFPSPGGGVADLRAITSSNISVSAINDPNTCLASTGSATTPCTVTVKGTTLEAPPSQPNGGGVNSTFGDGTITLGTPLANGASANVQFLLGIQTTGTFRFLIIVEALP